MSVYSVLTLNGFEIEHSRCSLDIYRVYALLRNYFIMSSQVPIT